MTLAIIATPTARESHLCWPTAAVAVRVKLNVMQALWPKRPAAGPPWGGQVDAGPAADHHSAGDDPGRGP
jgi:hypothetical protein